LTTDAVIIDLPEDKPDAGAPAGGGGMGGMWGMGGMPGMF
jgi:chaperonin GroEL